MNAVLNIVKSLKICNICKEEKPFSEFTKNNAASDGLQYKCRSCDVAYQFKRRIENREENLEYSRKYQQNRRKNFEYRLQMLINASKQRAKNKNREHSITIEDVKAVYPQDGCCPIFGMKLEFNNAGFRESSPSIDRINSEKGYTKGNIQIISWKANRIKGYASLQELEMLVAYMKQGE
jgi:hypothetical protein